MAKWLEEIADRLDLPAETAADLPKVTLEGDTRAVIENHRGLLEYTEETVCAAGGRLSVRITGERLALRGMDKSVLVVSGKIFGVSLE